MKSKKLVSIIIPLFNEEEIIDLFSKKLFENISLIKKFKFQVIYIDNCSSDRTLEKIKKLNNKKINIYEFSNYYGKENAILCGLDHSEGDYIIIMDPDLQDPPELIGDLINKIELGYDVVYAKRENTKERNILLKILKSTYYFLFSIFSDRNLEIYPNTGDFKIIKKSIRNYLCNLREYTRFNRSLTSYVSFSSTSINFVRPERPVGRSKSNYKFLINYGVNSIVSSSSKPLEILFYIGLVISILSFFASLFILFQKFIFKSDTSWDFSNFLLIFFISFITLTISVISLYLNRIYLEVKQRPNYILKND